MHVNSAMKTVDCTVMVRTMSAGWTAPDTLFYGDGMIDPKLIDDLARRLSDAVPANLRAAQQDIEKNFRTVLQNALARLDLVTREEFDVQTKVLARSREKLEALERAIAELEKNN